MNWGELDRRAGARYAAVYTLRIILLYAIVAVICIVFLGRFSHTVESAATGSGSGFNWVPWAVRFMVPIALVIPMAFMAGCYSPGDKRRLYWRLAVNVYMMAAIFVIAGDVSYTADSMTVGSTGTYAENVTLHVDTDGLLVALLVVPALSVADALLERQQFSGKD